MGYLEESEPDSNEKTWTLLAQSLTELCQLIKFLQPEENPSLKPSYKRYAVQFNDDDSLHDTGHP
jgi:hypothetical protein